MGCERYRSFRVVRNKEELSSGRLEGGLYMTARVVNSNSAVNPNFYLVSTTTTNDHRQQ